MEAGAIRAMLIEGLEAGGIWQASRVGVRERFLAGELDLTFAELELDSLARMELCIAIEVGTGVSLAPLVAEIERRTHA